MGAPAWLKPAITGGIVGAIATMVVGFSQAGWMLGSSAERMAQQKSVLAVTEALVPVCIAQSNSDPSVAAKLQELDAITSPYERREFVMKTGWATVPSTESPNREVAEACAEVLKAQQT